MKAVAALILSILCGRPKIRLCGLNIDDPHEAPIMRFPNFKPKSVVQYPVGTIALHGPDREHGTTITAAVTTRKHAEPILEQWLVEDVTDQANASQEISAMFRIHDVRTIAAWDRNIGCPHKAGVDYPVGSDCPYCPYWRGQQ